MKRFRVELEMTLVGTLYGVIAGRRVYLSVADVERLLRLRRRHQWKGARLIQEISPESSSRMLVVEYDDLVDTLVDSFSNNPRAGRLLCFLEYGHVRDKQFTHPGGKVMGGTRIKKECHEDEGAMFVSWLLKEKIIGE